jgi:hypothetical protein
MTLSYSYKSRISEFKTLPPKVQVTLPNFSPKKIKKISSRFGSLSPLSTEYDGIKPPEAVSPPAVKPQLDDPQITTTISTGCIRLYCVRFLSEEKVWTLGESKTMMLFKFRDKLVSSINTKSGNCPQDIIVTLDEYLVYTNPTKRTVNRVKNMKIRVKCNIRICSSLQRFYFF